MANIKEKDIWEDHIYQIETSDPVLGGENGIANRQAAQLAARTQFLKKEVEKRTVKHSPEFTGAPTAPTAPQSTNNGQIATTEFVKTAIAKLVGSAPAELDTLEELAAMFAENGDLRRTLLQKIAEKAPLSHSHTMAQITNLQSTLDGKANKATTLEGYGITDAINIKNEQYRGDLNNLVGKNVIYNLNHDVNNNANFPTGVYKWGILQTISIGSMTRQIYYPDHHNSGIWTRSNYVGRQWSAWHKFDSVGLISYASYPNFYGGAEVVKINLPGNKQKKEIALRLLETSIPNNGEIELNLPEEMPINSVIQCTDDGNAKYSYGAKMMSSNRLKLYAPWGKIVGVHINITGVE